MQRKTGVYVAEQALIHRGRSDSPQVYSRMAERLPLYDTESQVS
jgi:hypothetical protein